MSEWIAAGVLTSFEKGSGAGVYFFKERPEPESFFEYDVSLLIFYYYYWRLFFYKASYDVKFKWEKLLHRKSKNFNTTRMWIRLGWWVSYVQIWTFSCSWWYVENLLANLRKKWHVWCKEEVTYFAELSNFVWDSFSVFLKRKPDTVVYTLPKVYSIHFGVQAGVGVQNLKVRRSGVGVKNFRHCTPLFLTTRDRCAAVTRATLFQKRLNYFLL